jgi:uncharacterized protein (TIGR00159 family)
MESLVYLFSGLRWQDALDILLNSFILFRLYVLFRGTNVIRGLLTIGALWVGGQAAVSLGLVITNWAMQGVITVAALMIIIVFRNEISSVLQAKDLKSFLWGIPGHQLHTPLNIIIETAYELASNKIGALIVLPLKQGLTSVAPGGVPIDGKLTEEMLTSIFWPDNPLHDGAVVIQGDRIRRAGVILPLSKRKDLPAVFGTRHRAALGLTELTDAIVIVVSEERGRVSLFKENQYYTTRNRPALEKMLQEHAGDGSPEKGLRNPALEIVTAAIISLVCVTGLWLSFSKGMETLATHEVPVEFINPDQKMEIISTSASNVKLLISGARPLINAVKPEQINVKLNLSRSVVGMNNLSITPDNILLPPGIRLKQIDPSELLVTLDTLIQKQIPVQPNWIGKLPQGLVMTAAKAVPGVVRVIGGGLELQDIFTIFTEPIPLDRISESGSITVNPVLTPASLRLENSGKIRIEYRISKKSDLK